MRSSEFSVYFFPLRAKQQVCFTSLYSYRIEDRGRSILIARETAAILRLDEDLDSETSRRERGCFWRDGGICGRNVECCELCCGEGCSTQSHKELQREKGCSHSVRIEYTVEEAAERERER